MAFFRQEGDF